jgi:F-type H+-transporting ATPase subunit delta
MPQGASARRYAEAAFELAKKHNTLDRWLSDLKTAAGILADPQLLRTLENPKLPKARKRAQVDAAFPVSLDPLVKNLLYMLVDRERIGVLAQLRDAFTELYNRDQGIVVAEVTTAVDLDSAEQQKVEARLRQLTGAKRIDLRVHTDPRIIGGLIARVGDMLYDGSVRSRLNDLQERLG